MSEIKSILKVCRRCGEENLCKPTAKTCNKCFTKCNNEKLKQRNYFNENSKKYYKYIPIPKEQQLKRGRRKKDLSIIIPEKIIKMFHPVRLDNPTKKYDYYEDIDLSEY